MLSTFKLMPFEPAKLNSSSKCPVLPTNAQFFPVFKCDDEIAR